MREYCGNNRERIKAYNRERLTPERKAKYALRKVLKLYPKHLHGAITAKLHIGICEACGGRNPGDRRLEVDHNHETGAFRGVLCINCNLALGHLADDYSRILALAQYISEGKQ
jgi:hypothetical protein